MIPEENLKSLAPEDPVEEDYARGEKIRKVFSAVGALLIILSVAFYFIFTTQLKEKFDLAKADVAVKEAKLAEVNAQIDQYQEAVKKMGVETEVQKVALVNSIPVGLNQDKVIEDLYKIAKANEIDLKSLSFGVSEGVYSDVGALRINSSFEGNYSDLINFLEGIEDNLRLFKVSSVNVQINEGEEGESKRVTFSLTIDAYYQ
jgi:Tfp pilus assembly protein PilO